MSCRRLKIIAFLFVCRQQQRWWVRSARGVLSTFLQLLVSPATLVKPTTVLPRSVQCLFSDHILYYCPLCTPHSAERQMPKFLSSAGPVWMRTRLRHLSWTPLKYKTLYHGLKSHATCTVLFCLECDLGVGKLLGSAAWCSLGILNLAYRFGTLVLTWISGINWRPYQPSSCAALNLQSEDNITITAIAGWCIGADQDICQGVCEQKHNSKCCCSWIHCIRDDSQDW